jgi:hypothetical protein
MTRAGKKAKKRRPQRTASKSALPSGPKEDSQMIASAGVPEFAPTPERLARGGIATVAVMAAAPPHGDRDWTGDRAGDLPRKVTMGYVRQDLHAKAKGRLSQFRRLSPDQLQAAAIFEDDYERAHLEPKMIANLASVGAVRGGGRAPGPSPADGVVAARTAHHRALAVLAAVDVHGITPTVKSIVEAIVLHGARAEDAAAGRYPDKRGTLILASAHLSFGLSLLAAHYHNTGRMGRPEGRRA